MTPNRASPIYRPNAERTANQQLQNCQRPFQVVSLRVKLLIGFSLIFSFVFAGAFYWFYTFTTDKTITRLREDLLSTLEGAVEGVDAEELIELYEEGEPNGEGFSDDPRYLNQLAWFETVKSIEPRAWLYSYVVGLPEDNRRIGESPVSKNSKETIYLVDLWASYDPSKAVRFLEPDFTSSRSLQVMEYGYPVEEPRIYTDDWGTWLSAFAPIKDDAGNTVAILGLDIEADYVFKLQDRIRNRVLISFIITYGILFVLIYVLSGILTRNLTKLTQSAELIAAGDYNQSLNFPKEINRSKSSHRLSSSPSETSASIQRIQAGLRDEMNILAQAFETMVDSIRLREHQIREGKKIEDEMRQALQVERELNELKSKFVSIVSHEFRTPLTVLRTSVELLEKYGHLATEEKKQTYFQRIRSAITNMTQLLEDVLVVGRAEAGKLDFKPCQIELKPFCAEIVEEIQHGLGISHRILFHYESEVVEAQLDPNLLRSILTNLLSNAVKYSEKGSQIDFSIKQEESNLLFVVADQGIGIPKDDQPHLFQLFHRASNVDTIRGTGLGLAIVQQCVTRHRGHVKFESHENVGTTFYVRLPIQVDAEDNHSISIGTGENEWHGHLNGNGHYVSENGVTYRVPSEGRVSSEDRGDAHKSLDDESSATPESAIRVIS
ncbi:MAG: HAMP domain-containing sensor histidine kinase [Leptolyngbyaceae bacterium]|nr:HAMP domain-containing sensor histidine kinase [Leptolyngbyaceae bacterium]